MVVTCKTCPLKPVNLCGSVNFHLLLLTIVIFLTSLPLSPLKRVSIRIFPRVSFVVKREEIYLRFHDANYCKIVLYLSTLTGDEEINITVDHYLQTG